MEQFTAGLAGGHQPSTGVFAAVADTGSGSLMFGTFLPPHAIGGCHRQGRPASATNAPSVLDVGRPPIRR